MHNRFFHRAQKNPTHRHLYQAERLKFYLTANLNIIRNLSRIFTTDVISAHIQQDNNILNKPSDMLQPHMLQHATLLNAYLAKIPIISSYIWFAVFSSIPREIHPGTPSSLLPYTKFWRSFSITAVSFSHCTAHKIASSKRIACKITNNLHNLLLIHYTSIRRFKNWL